MENGAHKTHVHLLQPTAFLHILERDSVGVTCLRNCKMLL